MKIVETTPDRLVIEDRPWFFWLTLPVMGLALLVAALTGSVDGRTETLLVGALGAGMLWIAWKFAPFQRFVFDRKASSFSHQVHRLTGRQTWELPLTDIRRAADEGNWSDGSRLERVTLLTTQGRHPLEAAFSGTSRAPVIRAINDWLGV